MKLVIIWSDFTESQLDKIFEYYIENANYKIAVAIIEKIIAAPNTLISNPEICQKEKLLAHREQDYRYLVCENYKIIYSFDKDKGVIKITNVFDSRQNPRKIKKTK